MPRTTKVNVLRLHNTLVVRMPRSDNRWSVITASAMYDSFTLEIQMVLSVLY